jgi:hypothetical protein
MSITFNVNRPRTQIGHAVSCYAFGSENNWRGPVLDNPVDAVTDHDLSHIGNDECDTPDATIHCFPVYDTDADLSVNMSNTNAVRVLELLGFDSEDGVPYTGTCSTDDFEGRVTLARALTPSDSGIPVMTTVHENGPTVVDFGRRPGYLQDRLNQLSDLAALARTHNSPISWG